MSEVAQEADASVVTDEPVQNQADNDDKSKPAEAETNDNDEKSPEGGSEEVEQTPEEKLAESEKLTAQQQKKIDRQTASYSALQKTYQEQMQELETLRSQIKTEAPQEPKIEDFDTFEDFDKARVEFISKQAEQSAQDKLLQQQQEMQAQQQLKARMDLRASQEADYIKDNPNYRASVNEVEAFLQTVKLAPGTGDAVLDVIYDGNVPQMIDYFGKNNGENLGQLAEIASMNPVQAGIAIYKIQQSLTAPAPKEKTPPPKPLNKPAGGGKPKADPMKGSVLEHYGLKN